MKPHRLSILQPMPDAPISNLDGKRYRDGMARLAGAVNIIATDGPAGLAGVTASAVCSVSDNPPTLLFCLNRGSRAHPAITGNGALSVNVLAGGDEALSARFAGFNEEPPAARFEAGRWERLGAGVPFLRGALASFDCRVLEVQDVATHSVVFCRVEDVRVGEASDGLVYFQRGYRVVQGA